MADRVPEFKTKHFFFDDEEGGTAEAYFSVQWFRDTWTIFQVDCKKGLPFQSTPVWGFGQGEWFQACEWAEIVATQCGCLQ